MTALADIKLSPDIRSRYSSALTLLDRELKQRDDVLQLAVVLVRECEEARSVKGVDRYAERRAMDRHALARAKTFSRAAETLALYMRDFPEIGGFIAAGAWFTLRESGLNVNFEVGKLLPSDEQGRSRQFVKNEGGKITLGDAMARVFSQFSKSVTEHNPAGRGPWIWRSSIPGATYDKAIDRKGRGRRIGSVTLSAVLGFHLVFWLRALTTPGRLVVNEGMSMPKTGRPHYKVAREFVQCALNQDINVENAIKKNPGLQYMAWETVSLLGRPKRTGK